MSAAYLTPDCKSVFSLLEMLYGNEIEITENTTSQEKEGYLATFLSDDDELVALCSCDTAFVGYSGAALSMVPPDTVNNMIGDNDLSEAIQDNFYEVMNICSKLFMSDDSAHLRLDKTITPDKTQETLDEFADSPTVASFNVNIPKYGVGLLSFHIA